MNRRLTYMAGLALFSYLLLIVGHGYAFGHLGMIETLPYLKKLRNPALYPGDFYIEGIIRQNPNPRSGFVAFLDFFSIDSAWRVFVVHFTISMLLITGMMRIAMRYISSLTGVFLAVMLTLLILYNHNLGGNELYYNNLAPSLLAKAVGIWAIVFFLERKYIAGFLMLIPVTLLHALVGIQLFILLAGVLILDFWRKRKWPGKGLLLSLLMYCVIGGMWVGMLNKNFGDQAVPAGEVFSILKYRLGHHYFPSVFGWKNYVLLVPYFLFGTIFFRNRERRIFDFFLISGLGLVFYTIGVEVMHNLSILSSQWFKTTIWLKFFSSIALVAAVEDFIRRHILLRKWYPAATGGVFFILGLYLFLRLPVRHPFTLDLPWRGAYNDRIRIVLDAKKVSPADALFLTPVDFTHLKYFGERSTYVDYKATLHFRSKLREWYDRIHRAYIVSMPSSGSHERLTGQALQMPLDSAGLRRLESLGITHLITRRPVAGKTPLASEGEYRIFELRGKD